LKAADIYFEAHGMKPNTPVYPYFGNVLVKNRCRQVSLTNNETYLTAFDEVMTTDSNGSIKGLFKLPSETFKALDNDFMLLSEASLTNGGLENADTIARATFYGSNLTYAQGSSALNVRDASVSFTDVAPLERTISGLAVENLKDVNVHTDPPAASSGGGHCGCGRCFITTAAVEVIGESDDGPTLSTLRWFRDNIMLAREDWKADAEEYYKIAPSIVESLNDLSNSKEIYTSIYQDYLLKAVAFIKNEQYEEAYTTYRDMVNKYKEYI
jgi:hypothetical protein